MEPTLNACWWGAHCAAGGKGRCFIWYNAERLEKEGPICCKSESSWTKQAVELKSPEAASPCNQITEHPDSTCGLVIHPVQTQATWDTSDQEGQPYNGGKGKEIAIGRSRDLEMQTEFPIEVPIKHDGIKQNARQVFDPMQNAKSKDMELSDIKGEHSSNKNKTKASKMPDPRMENGKIEGQREPEKILDAKTKVIDDSDGVSEVSLKRSRATKHDGREVQNGCNTLRHSELSAFTRSETNKGRKYKTTSNAVKSMPGITASNSQPDNSSKIVKKESTHDAHSDGYLIYQGSNEQVTPRKADGIAPADVLHQELCIQHIHHHHHVHHYHNIDTELPLSNHDDFGLKELAADALHCGSSNIMGGAVHGNLENYNLNRSASGSRHGSNVQNGSDAAVTLEVTNVESDIGLDGKSASGDASGRGSRNRINHHKSAQREAALTKFLRKREV